MRKARVPPIGKIGRNVLLEPTVHHLEQRPWFYCKKTNVHQGLDDDFLFKVRRNNGLAWRLVLLQLHDKSLLSPNEVKGRT